jgi:hypothetical protein
MGTSLGLGKCLRSKPRRWVSKAIKVGKGPPERKAFRASREFKDGRAARALKVGKAGRELAVEEQDRRAIKVGKESLDRKERIPARLALRVHRVFKETRDGKEGKA